MAARTQEERRTQHTAALTWLADLPAVHAHCKQFKIEQLLEQGGGLARISGFLPPDVAAACNDMITQLPVSAWEPMSHQEQQGGGMGVIEHNFSFAEPEDHPETLALLAGAVCLASTAQALRVASLVARRKLVRCKCLAHLAV